ncbi:lactonase family protein [Streptomyces sp. SBT349]|uniref:lactonase family protein n=1 Tax=Streptomyces sp. SBT349 TaxID=1580539 RepID=UPI00069F847D|nr:lactonase family protein [Streptomyces sp. SBT349]
MSPQVSRRTVLTVLGATAGSLPLAAGAPAAASESVQADPLRFYLGAYTGGDGDRGIGVATADEGTGSLTLDAVVPTADPSFLALSGAATVLYAVNETTDGDVSAFSLAEDGTVAGALGASPSGGDFPCHLAVHPGGRHVFTANYGSGTVAVVALGDDGAPGEVLQIVQHTGSGPDPDRQEGPHAHMVLPTADGGRLFAVDLGTDSVHVYAFDPAGGQLTSETESPMPPGSGPRHLAFHPGGRTAYVLGELDSTLTTCAYDPGTGSLTPGAVASTLPDGTSPGGNAPAEILVSGDGRFVYTSNRGHDSIAVFGTEGADETEPRPLGHHPCGGAAPRHMAFDSTEAYLYVANQDTGTVAVFARDAATGGLTPVGEALEYPRVVCVLPAVPA